MKDHVVEDRCCGTASVGLAALVGRKVQSLTGFMGAKARWSADIAWILTRGRRVDHLILTDGGPWGDVWTVLRDPNARRDVALRLEEWAGPDAPTRIPELWRYLVGYPPPDDAVHRVAQYLWLQARSAGCIPIWYDPHFVHPETGTVGRWTSPSGARLTADTPYEQGRKDSRAYSDGRLETYDRRLGSACETGAGSDPSVDGDRVGRPAEKGVCAAITRGKGVEGAHETRPLKYYAKPHEVDNVEELPRREQGWSGRSRGVTTPATVAARVRALDRVDWSRVEVRHHDVRKDRARDGSVVYIDPPYQACPRYARTLDRQAVLDLANRLAADGARVVLSEAEPLPIAGWFARRIPHTRPEWLTSNEPIPGVWGEQLKLAIVDAAR